MSRRDAPRRELIQFICLLEDHIRIGKGVPDGLGTLTVNERQWSYCSAGLQNVAHEWQSTGGVRFEDIDHADLPRLPDPA